MCCMARVWCAIGAIVVRCGLWQYSYIPRCSVVSDSKHTNRTETPSVHIHTLLRDSITRLHRFRVCVLCVPSYVQPE